MAKSPRLHRAIRTFLRSYDNPLTLRSYTAGLDGLALALGDQTRVRHITPADLDRWRANLSSQASRYAEHPTRPEESGGLSRATVSNRIRTVKRFFNWCVERGYLKTSPARFLSINRGRQSLRSKAIPTPVLVQMLEVVRKKRERFAAVRDYAILVVMATYGARASDIAWLTLAAVNVERRELTFVGKGGDQNTLPLTGNVLAALQPWLEIRRSLALTHDALFVGIKAGHPPMKPDSVSEMIGRLSFEVCGKRYRAHAIRHWRGQSLADARVPPPVVQAILRHKSLEVTLAHYYNQDYSRVAAVLEVLDGVPSQDLGKILILPAVVEKPDIKAAR